VKGDKTLLSVEWAGHEDLSRLAGRPVKFRFSLTGKTTSHFYSFWISPDASGASHGYVAAGGPGFEGTTDTVVARELNEALRRRRAIISKVASTAGAKRARLTWIAQKCNRRAARIFRSRTEIRGGAATRFPQDPRQPAPLCPAWRQLHERQADDRSFNAEPLFTLHFSFTLHSSFHFPLRPLLLYIGANFAPEDINTMHDALTFTQSSSSAPDPSSSDKGANSDYSGVQACRALKEEGYRVVLINSNPATIMTDPEFADATYIEPIHARGGGKDSRPRGCRWAPCRCCAPHAWWADGLNTAMSCYGQGNLHPARVEMIGANRERSSAAKTASLQRPHAQIGLKVPKSGVVHTMDESPQGAGRPGPALIIRPAFTPSAAPGRHRYTSRNSNRSSSAASTPPPSARCSSSNRCRVEGYRDGGDARQE